MQVSTTSRSSPLGDSRTGMLAAVLVGLAVGCATSFGQKYMAAGAPNALVNSVSAWLVAPFFVGALMRTYSGAAGAGLATCALQVVGYYVTAELRGFEAGSGIVLFWVVCAVVGGPLFGVAGLRWRLRPADVGATVLPAVCLAEGLWNYLYELRYYDSAALWIVISIALALTVARRALRWLALTVPAAIAGMLLLTLVYSQGF